MVPSRLVIGAKFSTAAAGWRMRHTGPPTRWVACVSWRYLGACGRRSPINQRSGDFPAARRAHPRPAASHKKQAAGDAGAAGRAATRVAARRRRSVGWLAQTVAGRKFQGRLLTASSTLMPPQLGPEICRRVQPTGLTPVWH